MWQNQYYYVTMNVPCEIATYILLMNCDHNDVKYVYIVNGSLVSRMVEF